MKAKLRQNKFNSEGKKLSFVEKYPISHKYQIKDRIDLIRTIDFTQGEIKSILETNYFPIYERIIKEIKKSGIDLNIKGDIKLMFSFWVNVLGEKAINILSIKVFNKKYNYSLSYSIKPKEENTELLGLYLFSEDTNEYKNLQN